MTQADVNESCIAIQSSILKKQLQRTFSILELTLALAKDATKSMSNRLL